MIAHKNILKINDNYLELLIVSSGSYNKAYEENDYNKIIQNFFKEVTIDKTL